MAIELTPEELVEVFGGDDPTQHAEEAERRWGDTEAWAESKRRTAGYGKDDWLRIKAEGADISAAIVAVYQAGEHADSVAAMLLRATTTISPIHPPGRNASWTICRACRPAATTFSGTISQARSARPWWRSFRASKA